MYALYFATIGIVLPFLPAYLKALGLSGAQIGIALALAPLFALFGPPLWGHVADRTGRPDRVFTVLALGAAAGFAPLLVARSFPAVAGSLALYFLFASSLTTMLDTMALQRVAHEGGSYARLRLFGSVGFVLSSVAFGLAVDEVGPATVATTLALIVAYLVASLGLTVRTAARREHHPLEGLRLLANRDVRLLIAASCLHWIACAPFHATFALHVGALGLPPWVVGTSAGVGVVAEIAVMLAWPRIGERLAPRHLLAIAYLVSTLRWLGLALATAPAVIVALNVLHGFTFGVFYVASVAFIAHRAPAHLRASGQALFVAGAFGVGGLAGYLSTGVAYDALGGTKLFLLAAAAELLPAILIARVRAPAGPPAGA